MRKLPPLNALRAFEAAARHESFTKAAAELSVTQGAISQQVKSLEDLLGFKLFLREPQGLVLSAAAREYLEVIREAFDRIALGTSKITRQHKSSVLTVSTSPDFAAKWLVHRLGRFSEQHPEIDLRISASLDHIDFAREDIDMAVRHGKGDWPGLDAVEMFKEMQFPVCSPHLFRSKKQPLQMQEVLRYPLLHHNDRTGWTQWLKNHNLKPAKPLQGLIFNRDSLLIDAAISAQGIALSRTTLCAWDVLQGRLIVPFEERVALPTSYWIVAPQLMSKMPKISKFRDWLIAEADSDRERLTSLLGRDLHVALESPPIRSPQ
jgi:LysR family transcriptional regulator, glycine cleavage system transcriptional activator